MPLMCSDTDCDRSAARRLPIGDGTDAWWCTWHPDLVPPPRKGDVYVAPEPEKKAKALPRTRPPVAKPAPSRGLQRELDVLEQIDPVVAEAAKQYEQAVARIVSKPAAPATTPRRTPPGPVAKHLDTAEIARRYQAGEGLVDLAAGLHVSARRIRAALDEHNVTLRSRGAVQHRKPAATLDVEQCRALYTGGMAARDVARTLGVKAARVADQLRADGLLIQRRSPTSDIRVRVEPDLARQIRHRAEQQGLPVTDHVRQLLLEDLRTHAGAA